MDTSDKIETTVPTEFDLVFACRDDQGSVMPAGQAAPLLSEPQAGWMDRLRRALKEHHWATASVAGVAAASLAKAALSGLAHHDPAENRLRVTNRRNGHEASGRRERNQSEKLWTAKDIDRAIAAAKRQKHRKAKSGAGKSGLSSKLTKAVVAAGVATLQGKLNAKALQRASGGEPQRSQTSAGSATRQSNQGEPVPAGTRRKPIQRPFSWWGLIRDTIRDWSEDKASRLGAALAYYTVFSIAPLLVIVLAVAGYFWGPDAVQGALHTQMAGMLGEQGAEGVEALIAGANKPGQGIVATVVSVVVLLLGATAVFTQMKDALNTIWEVEPKPGRSWWGMIRDRFLSFAMVLGIAFLLLVTLVVSAALGAVMKMFGDLIPGPDAILHVVDIIVSVGVTTVLFALIFKYLPDVKIRWKDVWLGGLVTAVLFTVGKYAIGMYLGNAALSSSYGAASSIIIILLWAYYSSQILFFGAEFTEVYASMTGARIMPSENAVALTPERDPRQTPEPKAA